MVRFSKIVMVGILSTLFSISIFLNACINDYEEALIILEVQYPSENETAHIIDDFHKKVEIYNNYITDCLIPNIEIPYSDNYHQIIVTEAVSKSLSLLLSANEAELKKHDIQHFLMQFSNLSIVLDNWVEENALTNKVVQRYVDCLHLWKKHTKLLYKS